MTTISASAKHALDEFIKQSPEVQNLPGFVLGVSNVDEEIYFQGQGTNIIGDPTSGEVNPDSVFWICSQTKLVTALAALKLVEQGKINFETPVGDYLPQLRKSVIVDTTSEGTTSVKPAQTILTMAHLFNFTSGLFYPDMPDNPDALDAVCASKEIHTLQDPVAGFFDMITGDLPGVPLKFEPGTGFVYGWSSDVLGFVVEKVSGVSLEEFCKEHIFNPLGMETSFYLTPNLKEKFVDLTYISEDGNFYPWANQIEMMEQDPEKLRLLLGGTGLYSTMRDFLKLLRHIMQINAGRQNISPLWKQETIRQLFAPALNEKGSQSLSEMMGGLGLQWGTAMAVSTQDKLNGRKKGSAFWGGWAGTFHFIDPTTGIAAVFGVQVTPAPKANMGKVWSTLEQLIYSGVNDGAGD